MLPLLYLCICPCSGPQRFKLWLAICNCDHSIAVTVSYTIASHCNCGVIRHCIRQLWLCSFRFSHQKLKFLNPRSQSPLDLMKNLTINTLSTVYLKHLPINIHAIIAVMTAAIAMPATVTIVVTVSNAFECSSTMQYQ